MRAPVLSEPLLSGTTWTTTGGAQGDVSSTSTYIGHSGARTTWWVAGVGPVRVAFAPHGGSGAA